MKSIAIAKTPKKRPDSTLRTCMFGTHRAHNPASYFVNHFAASRAPSAQS